MENNKKIYKYFCDTFLYDAQKNHESAINKFFKKDAIINIVEPINEIKGSEELIKKFFLPMLYAFQTFIDGQIFFLVELLMKKNG